MKITAKVCVSVWLLLATGCGGDEGTICDKRRECANSNSAAACVVPETEEKVKECASCLSGRECTNLCPFNASGCDPTAWDFCKEECDI